jgi:hypothetical protein
VIEFLIDKDQEFSITANIKGVGFDPQIPEVISDNFPPFTLFALANYTYETIELTEDYIQFEAGFGAENFGSLVTIPLYCIFQIIVDESILLLNPTATVDKFFRRPKVENLNKIDQQTRSMNAFTMNVKNKKLLD